MQKCLGRNIVQLNLATGDDSCCNASIQPLANRSGVSAQSNETIGHVCGRSQISHWLGKIDAEASPGYYKVTSVSNRWGFPCHEPTRPTYPTCIVHGHMHGLPLEKEISLVPLFLCTQPSFGWILYLLAQWYHVTHEACLLQRSTLSIYVSGSVTFVMSYWHIVSTQRVASGLNDDFGTPQGKRRYVVFWSYLGHFGIYWARINIASWHMQSCQLQWRCFESQCCVKSWQTNQITSDPLWGRYTKSMLNHLTVHVHLLGRFRSSWWYDFDEVILRTSLVARFLPCCATSTPFGNERSWVWMIAPAFAGI